MKSGKAAIPRLILLDPACALLTVFPMTIALNPPLIATPSRLSLEDYFQYQATHDRSFELVNGELSPISLGTGQHATLLKRLEKLFDQEIERQALDWIALRDAVGVQSPRAGRWDTVRIPDVMVLPQSQWQTLQNREALIRLNEPCPLLVAEVVSESTRTIDYRAKRSEYSVLDIPEYWIVDPLEGKITILSLGEGWYDGAEFSGSDPIKSTLFPQLAVTAQAILGLNPPENGEKE